MTKRYVQVQVTVQRAWDIDGYPDYFFDEKGQFYRFTARGDVKPLRRTVKRYTQGYTLKSRFYSLAQLRPLLRRHVPTSIDW
ncbi:hypothetical protein ACFSUS_27455 [Spirosoma soli]|uniref:Uncharacterized protein n=1 Tax=Spirosoma soli TaxID=1770529 RepID=A0ABW5MFS5_9BACT